MLAIALVTGLAVAVTVALAVARATTSAAHTRADNTRADNTRAGDTRAGDTRAGDTRAGDTRAGDTLATDSGAGIPTPAPAVRARADAENLISRLRLPVGAVKLARKPAGGGGTLSYPPSRPAGVTTLVDEHTWWRVPGSAASVLDYLSAHPPRGGRLTESGFQGSGPGPPDNGFVGFSWHPVAKLLAVRQLFVEAVNLTGGGAGLRVDAQVQWIIPRPVSERIPRGVHEIDVTRGVPGKAPSLSIKTVRPHVIRTLVAMVNSLEITQPGVSSCPAVIAGAPVVTFTFRASDGGTVLASASQAASSREPTTPCDPTSFSVRGHAETPLLGGAAVVRKASRLLGVHLQTPPGPGFATGAAHQSLR
jgi:hypothetical protein